MNQSYSIAVLAGDGIGLEVMAPTVALLARLAGEGGFRLEFEEMAGGAALYRDSGDALPEATAVRAGQADAILLGAMGLPGVRYPDGREIAPQVDLRERFGLFAGVRPVKALAGLPTVLADPRAAGIDFVLVREQTEGLFADRTEARIEGDATARQELVITRAASERLFRFSFELARRRKSQGKPGRVTCVDKANILPAFAFFRGIFEEVAADYPDIAADACYVDAMAMNLVKRPWDYDVMVTENMFGDILSDQAGGLIGGLGFAPSADIGATQAVFQPAHGTAPDIMGQGKANPTATILSGALMLEWLGERHDDPALTAAGARLTAAVERAFAKGELKPFELGGPDGTAAIAGAVEAAL